LDAPEVAGKAQGGQFVIIRPTETGERIPLTIADYDREAGSLSIIFLEVGKTTKLLAGLDVGDELVDLAGPLGQPTHMEKHGNVVCVGGGVGIAAIHPVARSFREAGNHVISIIGAKTKSLLIWEDEMAKVSDRLIVATDDGSYGERGFVTQQLEKLIVDGLDVGVVFAVGPTIMMKAVCGVTKPHGVKTMVSLNPIMIDGTGMCGGCRVTVDGQRKFACVDGPDFDGHLVDFDELMTRQRTYTDQEQDSVARMESDSQNCAGHCKE